jgi:hypothetical protein
MTTITSQAHSETIAGWSPIGPLVSGMGSSVAFTILTGLAERPVFPLPSAFRTGYGPRCLSAQGQSRDLRHFSPMPTRCGDSVLRDMAHMGVGPVQSNIPHPRLSFSSELPGGSGPYIAGGRPQRPSNHRLAQESCQGRTIFFYRSSRVENQAFPRQGISCRGAPCRPLIERV